MPIHKIRLRGPWQLTPVARTHLLADGSRRQDSSNLPSSGRGQAGMDWGPLLGDQWRGIVRYRRLFGLPTALDKSDRVWIVIEAVDFFGNAFVNGQSIGEFTLASGMFRVDITSQLKLRNELLVDVELPDTSGVTMESPGSVALDRGDRRGKPGGLIGEVRLEIETS